METDAGDVRIVWITVPDPGVGRELARALLEAHAAACVNIVPAIESHYRWKGQIEESAEALLIVKTTAGAFERLREVVASRHPYECPEILAVAAAEGGPAYLQWVRGAVGGSEGAAAS